MSREYVDRGPYLCRYEARHGWVVYLNDAGDLKHLCSTNAEAKAKDIVGIMNADVARFDAKMRTPAPATAVEEARRDVVDKAKAWLARPVAGRGAYKGTAALEESIEALLAAEAEAADEGHTLAAKESRSDDRPAKGQGGV